MRACRFDASGVDPRQEFERNPALGVTSPAGSGCPIERFENRRLGNGLQLRPSPDRVLPELRAEVAPQGITIGEEPRLHDLDHQKRLNVVRRLGPHPAVAGVQVLPDGRSRRDRALAVDEQQHGRAGMTGRDGGGETVEGLFAS